jgi:hypothetical protein
MATSKRTDDDLSFRADEQAAQGLPIRNPSSGSLPP